MCPHIYIYIYIHVHTCISSILIGSLNLSYQFITPCYHIWKLIVPSGAGKFQQAAKFKEFHFEQSEFNEI